MFLRAFCCMEFQRGSAIELIILLQGLLFSLEFLIPTEMRLLEAPAGQMLTCLLPSSLKRGYWSIHKVHLDGSEAVKCCGWHLFSPVGFHFLEGLSSSCFMNVWSELFPSLLCCLIFICVYHPVFGSCFSKLDCWLLLAVAQHWHLTVTNNVFCSCVFLWKRSGLRLLS